MIHEIFDKVSKAKSKSDKIQILRDNNSGALSDILRGTFDDRIKWLLPAGDPPPYTPNKPESTPSNLIKECTKLAYLVEGGKGPKLLKIRREAIFIGLLESVHPKDAEILIDCINKKAPRGINKPLVKEAFPDLLPE